MTVKKEAAAEVERYRTEASAVAAELEAASRFSKTPLEEAQVYLFTVRLCDNQIDRDEEFFSKAAQ